MKSTRRKKTKVIVCILLLSLLLTTPISGCSEETIPNQIPNNWITELPTNIDFDVTGGVKKIPFTLAPGVNAEHLACILSEDNKSWCNVVLNDDNTLSISVTPSGFARSAVLTLIHDSEHKQFVTVKQKSDYSAFFTDESCSVLKAGITESQIETIPQAKMRELAFALLNNEYAPAFRAADYRPYQHPNIMAAKNKTNKYSLRDNPTGIYAEAGEELFIMLGDVYEGAQISMLIQDLSGGYNNSKTVSLTEGLNRVIAPIGGLIYILNHVDDDIPLVLESKESKAAAAAKTVKVHFLFGKVNGYFDIQKNTEADWTVLLKNAKYQDIDILGKYAHITWTVADFKTNNTEITKTVDNYDKLVYRQQEFQGLVKYNRMFNNRMHFSVDYKTESPNASDYRTVYNDGSYYAEPFCVPSKFAARCWGPAHEVGHCNQTRPGMKWAGMTEVTNNILSLHIQTSFGETCKLQKDKVSPTDEKGIKIPGTFANIYEASAALIITGSRAHCLPNIASIVRETQLVPFWQLKLYMIDALGKTDFYRDLYEYARNNDSPSVTGKNAGLDQLDFVRQVCHLSGLNMLDFFEKWGFLKPVNTTLNDYGNKSFIITESQIKELKNEIIGKSYAMPAPNVHEITDATWENYKK